MNLTPLNIRKQDFDKSLRGYDPEEVEAFLDTVATQWEEMEDERRRLENKVQELENQMDHYSASRRHCRKPSTRRVETLRRSLKTRSRRRKTLSRRPKRRRRRLSSGPRLGEISSTRRRRRSRIAETKSLHGCVHSSIPSWRS